MASFLESRDGSDGAALPAEVARVACIGDSLTYGGGVTPSEALPAALIEMLNGAFLDKLIWVDNLGKNGANLWHSWADLRDRIGREAIRYDAVLFSVCHNDAQIFDLHQTSYDAAADIATWRPGSATHDAAERLIADFGSFCRARGIVAVLYFYSRRESDVPIIALVAAMAARRDVRFVDLYAFLVEAAGISLLDYRASPFDPHPSADAHRLAARRLAMEVRDLGAFGAAPPIGGDMALAVADAAQTIAATAGGDVALAWARRVLAAKARAIGRRREAPASLGDLAAARDRIEGAYRRWRLPHDRAVAGRVLEARAGDFWPPAQNLDEWIIKLDELAYCVRHYAGTPLGERVADLLTGNAYLDRETRLRPAPADWPAELRAAEATARDERDLIVDLARGPGAPIPMAQVHIELIDRLLARLADLLNAPSVASPPAPAGPAARLVQLTNLAVDSALHYLPLNRRRLLDDMDLDTASLAAFTRVEVTIDGETAAGASEDHAIVFVDLDYLVPARRRHTTRYVVGVAHERFVHVYEGPLMLTGSVAVRLAPWEAQRTRFVAGQTRFVRVEVFNIDASGAPCGRRRRVWRRQEGVDVDGVDLPDIRLD